MPLEPQLGATSFKSTGKAAHRETFLRLIFHEARSSIVTDDVGTDRRSVMRRIVASRQKSSVHEGVIEHDTRRRKIGGDFDGPTRIKQSGSTQASLKF